MASCQGVTRRAPSRRPLDQAQARTSQTQKRPPSKSCMYAKHETASLSCFISTVWLLTGVPSVAICNGALAQPQQKSAGDDLPVR